MRVLVVDDNADIRLLVRMQIEFLDGVTSVHDAVNGVDAIEQAGQIQPHVIILDLDMPVMSGDAALPLLRTVAPDAHIVVHTATAIELAPREGLEHADAYLQKLRDDVGAHVADLVADRRQIA